MEIKVSVGELIDKITILSIKKEKISNEDKLKNITLEYDYLIKKLNEKIVLGSDSNEFQDLYNINLKLWDIENNIREKELKKEFDDEFIQIARSVYFLNDRRSEIKKTINLKYSSEIIEEKSYEKY